MYGGRGDLKAVLWWSFRAIDTRTGKPKASSIRCSRTRLTSGFGRFRGS